MLANMTNPDVSIERLSVYSEVDARQMGILLHSESPDRPDTPIPQHLLEEIYTDPNNRVIIAARLNTDGAIVSTESLNVIKSPDVGPADLGIIAFLGFVSTHPDYRRRGIFGMVWREGLGWCDERDIEDIEFTSNPNKPGGLRLDAIRFYDRHGAVLRNTNPYRVKVKEALVIAENN
jgi:GNAT superfamily N-acetyltransferase